MRAEVSQTKILRPDGSKVDAWAVTSESEEPEITIFSGPGASERATLYARSRYESLKFRVHAEMGVAGVRGNSLGANPHG